MPTGTTQPSSTSKTEKGVERETPAPSKAEAALAKLGLPSGKELFGEDLPVLEKDYEKLSPQSTPILRQSCYKLRQALTDLKRFKSELDAPPVHVEDSPDAPKRLRDVSEDHPSYRLKFELETRKIPKQERLIAELKKSVFLQLQTFVGSSVTAGDHPTNLKE